MNKFEEYNCRFVCALIVVNLVLTLGWVEFDKM